jgi:hypothetical protein
MRILLLCSGDGDLISRSEQEVASLLVGFLDRECIASPAQPPDGSYRPDRTPGSGSAPMCLAW